MGAVGSLDRSEPRDERKRDRRRDAVLNQLSVVPDRLSLRRCKGCGHEWPGYLERCRLCPAILGEPYERNIALVTSGVTRGGLRDRVVPAAVVALELSGNPRDEHVLLSEAQAVLATLMGALPEEAVLRTLPNGVVVALIATGSLEASVAAAASTVVALTEGGALEHRAGIATGLVYGGQPLDAAVVGLAAHLARGGRAGQTLCGYGSARLLDRDWQFAPAGVLPRRADDAVERATSLLGRKMPAPTPSAFAADQGVGVIGRASELAVLDHELADAKAGAGRWCAVVAPAGGGKSKLLRTWIGRLDPAAINIAGATATAFGQAPRALLDQLLGVLGASAPGWMSSDEAAALAAGLERAARERPLLVLIDDLHWADTESVAVLRGLAALPRRCLVVVALRTSFVPVVPWLLDRARRLELPPLGRDERIELLRRLLPADVAARTFDALVDAPHGDNPLYLEQAAAYLRETGLDASLPRSLHEAVMRRLELVRGRLGRHGYDRPSADDLAGLERTVGEWLDRLETEDFQSREQIAEYLSVLEQIDAALVIERNLAGLPLRRNRRLAAAIERFYSASFGERAAAIERLAERDRPNAAYAAARGAERALAAVRLDDGSRYLQLAADLADGEERARHLLALGDVLVARGLVREAWHAYAAARRTCDEEGLCARCDARLGHTALARGRPRPAEQLIDRALPRLREGERLQAQCDVAVARATAGREEATVAVRRLERAAGTNELAALLHRTRLRLVLLGAPGDRQQLSRQCAAALDLEGDPVADLSALIETTLLLLRSDPSVVGRELLNEAARTAARLGSELVASLDAAVSDSGSRVRAEVST